ncbi:MAG: uracil-DNA glycosylase [Gammaproteobacteria bacterium]|nr:uracil-DNA glycosylase [Gammaproteobacteria bacterium]
MNHNTANIRLIAPWADALADQFNAPYMQSLKSYLRERKQAGATILPAGSQYFAALDAAPPQSVKVVILGQDPYHGPNQAHGLSFSVPEGVAVPPSLRNIYKELQRDLGIEVPEHGCLIPWAQQGVLLLNCVLTVELGQAAAHAGKGWEQFTDAIIKHLATNHEHIVFMLWGKYAQKKGQWIARDRHLVLQSVHPSPLSAHRGFIGCGHFSAANRYLASHQRGEIDWRL